MLTQRVLSRVFSTLKLPGDSYAPQRFTGNAEQILSSRKKHIGNIYQTYYQNPLIITQGHLQYLFDHKGNRYLDLEGNGGQVSLGHNHPAINKVVADQSSKLIHTSTIYMSQNHGELSKQLSNELGQGFQHVYLCNSQGEAVDFAVYISRLYSNEHELFSYRNAYHSLLGSARSVTNLGSWSTANFSKIDCQRLSWPSTNSTNAANQAIQILSKPSSGQPGTLIYQPIQTKSGVHLPPQGYLKTVTEFLKSKNGVNICDQTNTGFGRIGKEFWGHRWTQHRPDVVILGSSLGNGFPISAVVTRKQISTAMKHVFFNTFCASHLTTKIGIQTLKTIKAENLSENAEKVGVQLLAGLKGLAVKYNTIKEIRGKGLLIGIEIQDNKVPSREKTLKLLELSRERQLLFGVGGVHKNVLLVRPPLSFTSADAKYLVEALEDALIKLG